MKISGRVAKIFAHAVALQQSGRLRNTIYCQGNTIYILNQDNTIIMKFLLRSSENRFTFPINFNANDYDLLTAHDLLETDEHDKVIFIQHHKEFIREKKCVPPDIPFTTVRKMYKSKIKNLDIKCLVTLGKDFKGCLQEDLSHIEFSSYKGKFKAIQRHIYTGALITITKNFEAKPTLLSKSRQSSFGPIGVRTNDFLALYTFTDSVKFGFTRGNVSRFESKHGLTPFVGILSHCKYDELGSD